mmetsp:Transcript_8600/g.10874  ORF Transcript_8600/g.10874 Transcript_8600/m.10874 type:complete len:102 (-) Transcript_8600:314-619(-)
MKIISISIPGRTICPHTFFNSGESSAQSDLYDPTANLVNCPFHKVLDVQENTADVLRQNLKSTQISHPNKATFLNHFANSRYRFTYRSFISKEATPLKGLG